MRSQYTYPARIERGDQGRYQVRFADLPDALTDGGDPAEALTEAADCLSAALASRIIDGEEIPDALAAGTGSAAGLTGSDDCTESCPLCGAATARHDGCRLGSYARDGRLAPGRTADRSQAVNQWTTLMAALDALRCQVEIAINDVFVPEDLTDFGASGKMWATAIRFEDAEPPPAMPPPKAQPLAGRDPKPRGSWGFPS